VCRSFGTCGKLGQLGTSQDFQLSNHILASDDGAVLKRDSYDSDSTPYLHSYRRDHHRAVTGLWLTSLHDGK